jgi:hypothetical protein
MTVPRLIGAIAVVLLSSSASAQPSEFDGPGYRLVLPSGVTGKTEAKVDFDISTFKKADGQVLLSAYSGLHPNFGGFASRDARSSEERINRMPARRLVWTNSEKKMCAETLITIRGSVTMSFSVHFWYCAGSEADQKRAEEIIRSIRPEA